MMKNRYGPAETDINDLNAIAMSMYPVPKGGHLGVYPRVLGQTTTTAP